MVDRINGPDPSAYSSFNLWIRDAAGRFPKQTAFAKYLNDTSPQLIHKWIGGTVPQDENLQLLAEKLSVDLNELRRLAAGLPPLPARTATAAIREGTAPYSLPVTELGARVGRKWERLDNLSHDVALQVLSTIEVMIAALDNHVREQDERQRRESLVRRGTSSKA